MGAEAGERVIAIAFTFARGERHDWRRRWSGLNGGSGGMPKPGPALGEERFRRNTVEAPHKVVNTINGAVSVAAPFFDRPCGRNPDRSSEGSHLRPGPSPSPPIVTRDKISRSPANSDRWPAAQNDTPRHAMQRHEQAQRCFSRQFSGTSASAADYILANKGHDTRRLKRHD
jgi:hypothetical protein